MRQNVVTLSADVQPRSLEALRACVRDLKEAVETPKGAARIDGYEALGATVPSLHFASIMVFEDDHYDPLLTVELNIDGTIEAFLPRLETAGFGPFLRAMVRCCKKPMGAAGALYDAVTAPGSTAPLAPFLATRIVRPAVFHQGSRGLDRDRIRREAALFGAAQEALAAPELYRAPDAVTLHQGLRAALIGAHPWLDAPEPERWSRGERAADWMRLALFAAAAVVCLALPGMILALVVPPLAAFAICLVAAIALAAAIRGLPALPRSLRTEAPKRPGLPYVPPPTPATWLVALGVVVVFLAAFVVVVAFGAALLLWPFHGHGFGPLYRAALAVVATGVLTIELPLALVLFWLRWLEDRDPTQDEPRDDPGRLRAILAAEDHIAQNHMGSLVLIKPGVLRAVVVRAGLWGLGLVLRATRTDGYLASMRTIHFAHWAILGNGGRLVFFSNFDSSWESYLDDFIEKAHVGLTLAWTNAVGFAPTEFLVAEGATSGRLFKAWARHSMAEGLFWFSAYKDLSVNQIERQYRVASGLRRASLTPEDAKRWAHDL